MTRLRTGGISLLVGRTAVLGASAVAVSGCLPTPATTQGRAVTDLWALFAVAAALVGGLVWVLITISIIRYRRSARRPQREEPRNREGDDGTPSASANRALPLEIAWTVGPIAIVIVLFIATLVTLDRMDAREPSRTTVVVTAFQWQWRFDYHGTGVSVSGGPGTPAEMVVPAGEPVHIELVSTDVAHSFYVPAFLFKRDAIPGRVTTFDFTVEEPGNYRGQCAEFCGVQHDRMLLTVRAVTRAEFDAWLAGQRSAATPGPSATAASSAVSSTVPAP